VFLATAFLQSRNAADVLLSHQNHYSAARQRGKKWVPFQGSLFSAVLRGGFRKEKEYE
jgi:hypothetical protein